MTEPFLSDAHRQMLRVASAISDQAIAVRGYRTVREAAELSACGFEPQQCRAPGLLIPLWTTDGEIAYHVLRPDHPRVFDDRDRKLGDGTFKQRVLKYELPKGQTVRLDCSPLCLPDLGDPTVPLWITEGQKKGDALASAGLAAIALLGVWNWRGRNPLGGLTVLADWERVALNGRQVIIGFDSDVTSKPEVQAALRRLGAFLQNKGAHVDVAYLPHGERGAKQGVDDYLAAGHSVADLVALVDRPRPQPVAALPVAKLLDGPPQELNRPLQLIETGPGVWTGHAAAWLYVEVTRTESLNSRGELVRHNPPQVANEQHLFVVREDGTVFGDQAWVGVRALEEVGLAVRLPEIPPESRQWSAQGVRRYLRGDRPDPAAVFGRLVEVFDRFIDFDRSLAGAVAASRPANQTDSSQSLMCSMAACYVMASYMLDAFTVTGYLWPTGERGSGKTQFLTLISELGFLGTLMQIGGTFASLRDLSDYGALLCFDDAENLSDPRTDPDKRALLLAGNRKGMSVPVKEPVAERGWRTRLVRTFTPRCFSAINTPDAVLASRAILAPLVRTSDRGRANADVLDYRMWPHDRRGLIDDLWAVGLAHVSKLGRYETLVNERAELLGRSLEPWRTILAVALWLDDVRGGGRLYEEMSGLAAAYQAERRDLEREDLTTLVLEAVARLAGGTIRTVRTIRTINTEGSSDEICLSTTEVTEEVRRMMEERESELQLDWANPRRVGRILSKLRFTKGRYEHIRAWSISRTGFGSLLRAYNIAAGADESQPTNGTNGPNGPNGPVPEPYHDEAEDGLPVWREPAGLVTPPADPFEWERQRWPGDDEAPWDDSQSAW